MSRRPGCVPDVPVCVREHTAIKAASTAKYSLHMLWRASSYAAWVCRCFSIAGFQGGLYLWEMAHGRACCQCACVSTAVQDCRQLSMP